MSSVQDKQTPDTANHKICSQLILVRYWYDEILITK